MSDPEIWLHVPGTDGLYSVSTHGRVRSEPRVTKNGRVRKGKVVKGCDIHHGFLKVCLGLMDGRQVVRKVHQLVAEAFIGPRPAGYVVTHKDGDKSNNRPDNLEYVKRTSLTPDDVLAIRSRYPAEKQLKLAMEFGVSASVISAVISRKSWAWLGASK